MPAKVKLDSIYVPSPDVISREIEGELIIVPLAAGIGDMEDELFTMNKPGRAIWEALGKEKTVKAVCAELAARFKSRPGEIQKDVVGLIGELLKRKLVLERTRK